MSTRQGSQILGLDTSVSKHLPVRMGNQTQANSMAVTLASDEASLVELQDIGITLDNIETILTDVETNTDFGTVIGGGVEATALRVTLASDSTGVLTVDATDLDIRDLTNNDVVSAEVTVVPTSGTQDNLWASATPGAGGKSGVLDVQYCKIVDFFGYADGACTISVEYSQNNVGWYGSIHSFVLSGAGDFHISITTAARYVRLDMSTGGVQITATGVGKG